jgi:hypothetical protein
VIKQAKFKNKNEALDSFFADIGKAKVVIEACYGWEPVYDKLSEKYDVILAHPKEIKAIAKAKIKNDKVDSLILARLLRADLIPQAYAPSKEIRELRSRCRNRTFLVSLKTRLLNKIRSRNSKKEHRITDKVLGKKSKKILGAIKHKCN